MPSAVPPPRSALHRPASDGRARRARVAALLLSAALAAFAAGCSSSPAATSHGPTITMAGLQFFPGTLTVSPGATITVVNNDHATHNVTSTTGKFKTADVRPGASTTFRAPTIAGRYPYFCTIHPFMRATLVVR